ncbi:MAG: CoA transferase [Anaerolineales bacterium]|nr:CoA transferase [Anaerolineales bacterium]
MLGLLSGARILDLSHMLAGPFGSMMMGDLGAEIIKIEPREGDPMRQMGPHFFATESAYYLSANRSKQSITLNLQTERGRAIFYDLVKISDVVYDNFRPGITQKLQIDFPTLQRINPRIIACSISGFGQTGPYRDRPAFDIAIQGLSGAMSITGVGEQPARMGIAMGDLAGGMYAAFAVAAALYQREKTGKGCCIDLSLLDSLTSLLTYVAQYFFHDGVNPGPQGTEHMSVVPYQSFQTKDGFLVVAAFTEKFWQGLCRALDLPRVMDDPRFAKNDARRVNKTQLVPLLSAAFLTRTTGEWQTRLDAESVPWGPINKLDRVMSDPQILARQMKIELDHPTIGKLPMLGNPVKVQGVAEPRVPPPLRGQHTAQVLAELLGYSSEQIAKLKKEQII